MLPSYTQAREKRAWLALWFACCAVLSASHAEAEPRGSTHVACVGDSITFGVGASSANTNYPATLQKLLGDGTVVANFGHSGATMLSAGFGDAPYQDDTEYQAATNFVNNAGPGAVVDVIIMLGANDSRTPNWTPDGKPKNDQQFLKDYRAMVEHFSALTSKPVVYLALPLATGSNCSCGQLCCQISASIIHDEELPLIEQLAQEKQLPIIDLNTPTTNHPEYFADGVHPNDAGYELVAQTMLAGLLRLPSVMLTAPSSGAPLDAAVPILLTASASSGTVPIERVEFFQAATSLGQVSMAPFALSWVAPAGSYQLRAKATDSTQASATTDPISITVAAPVDVGGTAGVAGTAGSAATSPLGGASAGTAAAASGAGGGGAPNVSGGGGGSQLAPNAVGAAGCACRAPSHAGNSSTVPMLLALSLLARRGRRRALRAARP